MNGKTMLAAVVVVIGVSALVWSLHGSSAHGSEGGTYWLCNKCGHSFTMSKHELGKWYEKHYGQALPCPDCGSDQTVKAYKCQKCGDVFAVHGVEKCPKCGEAVGEGG
jgi:DNA-directed RNA polymerase subunit RPC12/RpoP